MILLLWPMFFKDFHVLVFVFFGTFRLKNHIKNTTKNRWKIIKKLEFWTSCFLRSIFGGFGLDFGTFSAILAPKMTQKSQRIVSKSIWGVFWALLAPWTYFEFGNRADFRALATENAILGASQLDFGSPRPWFWVVWEASRRIFGRTFYIIDSKKIQTSSTSLAVLHWTPLDSTLAASKGTCLNPNGMRRSPRSGLNPPPHRLGGAQRAG